MKNIILAVYLTTVASVSIAAGVEIPTQFQGTWGANKSECKDPEAKKTVKAKSVSFGESGCDLTKVIKSEASIFIGTFKCSGPDGDTSSNVKLELNGGKLALADDKPRSRCK